VLVDTEKLYFEATRLSLSEKGIILTRVMYNQYYLQQSSGSSAILRERGFSEEEITEYREIRNRKYAELIAGNDYSVSGAREVLESLHGRVKMCIVTSSLKEHFEIIHSKTGMLKYIDFVLAREDYRKSKPDPEPYLAALRKSGVAPAEAIVIEDSLRGLKAARSAGLKCWVIPNEFADNNEFKDADKILGGICDIPKILA